MRPLQGGRDTSARLVRLAFRLGLSLVRLKPVQKSRIFVEGNIIDIGSGNVLVLTAGAALGLTRVVFGPLLQFGHGLEIFGGRECHPGRLLPAELHVAVVSIFAKLPTAKVTSFVGILGLARLLLFRCDFGSRGRTVEICLILPNFVRSVKYLFRFAFDFLTNL